MASSVTIANINQLIAEVAPKAVDDCISRSSVLWNLLQKVDASDAAGPRWKAVLGANTSASATVPGEALPTADAADLVAASMNWANIPVVFTISQQGLAEIEKAANLGQALANMLEVQLVESAAALVAAVNTGLISGSDTTKDLIGICTQVVATGTVAGIAKGSYAEWACYVNTDSPRALTVALMNTAYDYAVNTTMIKPGRWVILAGSAQYAAMAGFASTAGAASSFTIADSVLGVTQHLSKTSVMFRDIPVVNIPGYTAARIDFVNLDGLSIECLHGAASPFKFYDGQMDALSDLTVFKGYFNGQLVLRDPKHNAFSITALT